jgi:hypothetical protein
MSRRVLADLSPLRRHPRFRTLWLGYLVSFLGGQLTVVAVPYQIFRLTHSSAMVGLVSLVQLGPLLIFSLVGGSIADALDRQRLLLITQSLLAVTSVGLALNSLGGHPALWPLFALTAASAGLSGIDSPARAAAISTLVDQSDFAAANALWQILVQVGIVAGPAAAGLLLARLSVSSVYWIDVATFAASLFAVTRLGPLRPQGEPHRAGWRSIREGLAFLRGRQLLQANFLIDVNAMVFGMPRALFPALGLVRFHGSAAVVGALYAAPGVGALLGALFTGWVGAVRRQGRAVLVAVSVWGVAIAGFGLSPWLPLALGLLAVAGAADVVSAVFRNTILQSAVPDALRGRLSSVHTAVVTGGPRLGDAEAGGVASLAGAQFSVVSGGLACVVGAGLIGVLMPALARQRVAPGEVEVAGSSQLEPSRHQQGR